MNQKEKETAAIIGSLECGQRDLMLEVKELEAQLAEANEKVDSSLHFHKQNADRIAKLQRRVRELEEQVLIDMSDGEEW